ncbi:MAG: nucleotidyltransferase domain-containing protein [Phycisphaerales bacterium]|nr:nucleotidyltransferase domain-containing protein [Phycisphaerales bacterium]
MVPLIRDNLDKITELCAKHQVRRLFLIGSALGDGFDPERSDVDFLVEFEPHEPKGFDDVYFLLLADLKGLLGREVELIAARAQRNPYFIASLNRTKRVLYAA